MNEWMNEVNIFVSEHISVPLIYYVSECIYNLLQFSAEMNMSGREKNNTFYLFWLHVLMINL